MRTCKEFYDYIGFRPKYKVSERVKYMDLDPETKKCKGIRSTQIKQKEFKQIRKQNDISYKLSYYTGRKWIDEGQIIDWSN